MAGSATTENENMNWKDALLIVGGILGVAAGSIASKLLLLWLGMPQ